MKEYRISFIGDVIEEYPVLRESEKSDGTYDFYPSLAPLSPLLAGSDYVVANLETPLGGEEAGYVRDIFSMNTPDAIVDALKSIGVTAVTTANNHMMDRGPDALRRTCRVLDEKGMAHTGTYVEPTEDRNLYFDLGGVRIALLSYSVSANYGSNKKYDFSQAYELANFLRPYDAPLMRAPEDPSVKDTVEFIQGLLGRKLGFEDRARLRRAMHMPVAYADDVFDPDACEPLLARLQEDYDRARAKADLVVICPHSGGQFNTEPGRASMFFFERMARMGFDAVMASHSHTTQRVWREGGTLICGCLGNVTMSPLTGYMSSVPETLPAYGMVLHLYVGGGDGAEARITRAGFSLFKAVQDETHPLRAVPVTTLLEETTDEAARSELLSDIAAVHRRITGREMEKVEEEWAV